jgi:SAM-dependent methyltransferase
MAHAFDEAGYLRDNPDVAAAVQAGQFDSGWQHYEMYGREEGRSHVAEAVPDPAPDVPQAARDAESPPVEQTVHSLVRFERRAPSAQNAIDIFRDRWASDLGPLLGVSGTGTVPLFTDDDRPQMAANVLGTDGRLDGLDVLELGPLEGGHTYQLERLGARSITAVEASVEAYLKCLVVKETLSLQRSRYLLGDVVEFLTRNQRSFDIVFCSGILYHMADPLLLIREIARVSDKCFVWTHYYDRDNHRLEHHPREHAIDGFSATYWSHVYGDKASAFWGGNQESAAWLERDTLFAAFRHFGFTEIVDLRDDKTFINGPNVSFTARRPT